MTSPLTRRALRGRLLTATASTALATMMFCTPESAAATGWTDCAAHEVTSVKVSPCSGGEPCTLHHGQDTTFTISFVPTHASDTPKLNVKMNLSGLWIDYPGLEELDLCEHNALTPSCSVKPGTTYTLRYTLRHTPDMPNAGNSTMIWNIYGGEQAQLACARIPVRLQ